MNFSEAKITRLFVHFIGNKLQDGGIKISKKKVSLTENEQWSILKDALLAPFNNVHEFHVFDHPSSLKYNEVYGYVTAFWAGEQLFQKTSAEIAAHLYDSSAHPKVKPGELLVFQAENCEVDGNKVEVIGIYKTETKDPFLNFSNSESGLTFDLKEGVNPLKGFQKACLIFNMERESGFKVCIIDNQNKFGETQYWGEKFLNLKPKQDNYQHTKNFLSVCKEFVAEKLPQEFEVTKAEQIDLLNKSIDYFKKNKDFEMEEFAEDVFRQPELIKSFKEFKNDYQDEHDLEIEEAFDVSAPAVKKQVRNYKSVLKLDKNFHIYIHGDRSKIEQGVEKDGRKFYKIYFEKEL